MPTPILDFSLTFQLDQAPKKIKVIDLGDYSGWSPANKRIDYTVLAPDGAILDSGNSITFPLTDIIVSAPLLSDGTVEPGIYKVIFELFDTLSGDVLEQTKSKAFDFCYESPEVTISLSSDCIKPELISSDTTNYAVKGVTPTIVRLHEIFYPSQLGLTPASTTGSSFVLNNFFTETHTASITSTLAYTYPGDLFIEDEVTGSQEHKVVCDATLCDLYCCLIQMYERYRESVGVNNVLAKVEEAKFIKAMSIRSLIKDSLECNKGDNVNSLVSEILKIGGCQPGCGCSEGDAPVPVIGLTGGTGSITLLATSGNGIEIATNTIGDTTTYTLSLESALVTKLNALRNATVTATTSNLVTVTPTVDGGGNVTYDISDAGGFATNRVLYSATLQFIRNAAPVLTIDTESVQGVDFQASSGLVLDTFEAVVDYDNKKNRFSISDFLVAAGGYNPTITVTSVKLSSNAPISPFVIAPEITPRFNCRINSAVTTGNGKLLFSLYETNPSNGVVAIPTGNAINSGILRLNKALNVMTVKLSIEITK